MPKFKIVCFVLAAMLAAVGTVLVISNFGGDYDIPDFEAPTEDANTYLDLTDDVDITNPDVDAIKVLFIAHKRLLLGKGFYGVSNGYTKASGVKQNVKNTRYVVGEFGHKNSFKEMVTSGVAKNAYQLFMYGDNYIFRDYKKVNSLDSVTWADTAQPLAKDAFYSKFGHRSDTLTGYILNEQTVKSGKLEGVSNGLYTFRYELDKDTATIYLRREMITNGGLVEEPTFQKCVIYVTIDADYNIKTLRTDCVYNANLGFLNAKGCTEDITEVIEPYDGELPEKDFYEKYFDAEGGDITKEKTALDVLLEMFGPYLNGTDLQVSLTANKGSRELVSGLLSVSGLDISDLTQLQVAANIGGVSVDYHNANQAIYLKYQDFKGSTTVSGVMDLVQTLGAIVDGETSTLGLDGSALGNIDPEELLADLSYSISEDGKLCTVSLPMSLAGLNIDANLYADVDDETYTFKYATVVIGDVELTVQPQTWTVEQIVASEYPEILGLADLVSSGKLSLTASVNLPIGNNDYAVDADVLVDLATLNLQVSAKLGDNGTAKLIFVDKVAYVQFGGVKVKLDTANMDGLLDLIEKYVDLSNSVEMPTVSLSSVLAMLSGITATQTDGGVAFKLSASGIEVALNLKAVDNRWQIHSITVVADGIDAKLAPSDAFGEVNAPTDAANYADITEVIDTFDDIIYQIVHSESYGADFRLDVTLGKTDYEIAGRFDLDRNGNIKVKATVSTDNVGIVDAEVIYANNTVFLTVNGISVAFAVGNGGSSEMDFAAAMDQLFANKQIKALLDNHQELAELIEEAKSIIGGFTQIDIASVDFSKIVSSMTFEDGKLTLRINGSEFGLKPFTLIVANNDEHLFVAIEGFKLASVKLNSVSATLLTDVGEINVPSTDDYILNLQATVKLGDVAIDVEISADLFNMDIWAVAHIGNEEISLRYVNGKVYVKYGKVALMLDTDNLGEVVDKVASLVGSKQSIPSGIDVDSILASINFNLTANNPCISYKNGEIYLAINFENVDGVLSFDNITATFGEISVEVEHNGDRAPQLDTEGTFVDGNKLVNQIVDTVETFIGTNGVEAELTVSLDVNGNKYEVVIALNYNEGLHATVQLIEKGDSDSMLLTAEVYLVDDTLYIDVNGIRQAIRLPKTSTQSDGIGADSLKDILAQFRVVLESLDNEVINSVLECLDGIPTSLEGIDFYKFVSEFRYDGDTLVIGVDLEQLGLEAFTVSLNLGENLGVNVHGLALGKVSADVDVTVANSSTVVTAPALSTYVTELQLSVGDDVTALVKLDLYNKTVVGKAEVYGQTINFKLVDGTVYAIYGQANTSKVRVKLNLNDIDTLLESVSKFVVLPDMSVDTDVNLVDTIVDLLGKIKLDKQQTANGYSLDVLYDQVSVSIRFNNNGETVKLETIELNVGDINVSATQVSGQRYPNVSVSGNYVDLVEVVDKFAEPIANLMNASGYSIGFNGNVTFGNNKFGIKATLEFVGGNIHVIIDYLKHDDVRMLEDVELWIVDNVLYLDAGDMRLAVSLGEKTENGGTVNISELKQQLTQFKDYNGYVDTLLDLVVNILDTPIQEIDFEALLSSLSYTDGVLSVGINGEQFGLSAFTLTLHNKVVNGEEGLKATVKQLACGNVALNVSYANVAPYVGSITVPNEDFTTNLVIDVQELVSNNGKYEESASSASKEHNVIYVNIDLMNGVILASVETIMKTEDGDEKTHLDVKYTFDDNILRLTNRDELLVLVNIDNIADIVDRINDIVNDFAGAGDQELPDLMGKLGGDLDVKSIVKSMSIGIVDGKSVVGLSAMGFDVTATFNSGVESVTIPVKLFESRFVASFGSSKANYADFPTDDSKYVSVDQVFNDYYYGADGEESDNNGPIYDLVHTNSWKFDFTDSYTSTITVGKDMYRIRPGSYVVFYYNKTDAANSSARANLQIDKFDSSTQKYDDFIILDVAFVEGRIFVSYDSDSDDPHGGNVLRATVSLDAIQECMDLLPALINVIPQVGTLINNAKAAMSNAQSKMTLGNVSKIIESVSYVDRVFTLEINGQAIDSNNFGKEPITLRVKEYYGDDNVKGLCLDYLSLDYGNVSARLGGLVVTGSKLNEETGKFRYVEDYIMGYFADNKASGNASGDATTADSYNETNVYGYDLSNHMNLDSIYELLSALAITAGNFDEYNQRSFYVEGDINVTMNVTIGLDLAKIDLTIHVTMYADIDAEGDSYFAVKLVRDYTKANVLGVKHDVYDDHGGNSYLTFTSAKSRFNAVRDSLQERSWCTQCTSYNCTGGKNIFGQYYHRNSFKTGDVYDSMYNADVYYTPAAPYAGGTPSKVYDNITLSELVANINTTEGECPVFELLNLGTMNLVVYKLDLEQTIRSAIGQPSDSVYGVEDILKSYSYTPSEPSGGTFAVVADMSPINDVLGTLKLNILHTGNFDDLYYDERGILRGVTLTDINGTFGLFENSSILNMEITLNLHHSTPEVYGTAEDYATNKNFTW